MIVLIIGHFLTSVEFREIPQQYENSVEKGKFRGSARNSATHGKLWALLISNCWMALKRLSISNCHLLHLIQT